MNDVTIVMVAWSSIWTFLGAIEFYKIRSHEIVYGSYRGMYVPAIYWWVIGAAGFALAWYLA